MSETPEQVLWRLLKDEDWLTGDYDDPHYDGDDRHSMKRVAAAFLAEMAKRQPPLVVERKGYDLEPPFGGRTARSAK